MATKFVQAKLTDENGELIGILTANQKQFKTGSRGFWGGGKMEIEGARYQVQVQLVEIGSKNKEESGEDAEQKEE